MKIEYRFDTFLWDESSIEKSIKYWEENRFQCRRTNALGIEGKRGSIWGNLVSFDMTKLICDLDLTFSHPKTIKVSFNLNTFGQIITGWNMAFLQLEMLLFRRHLLNLTNCQVPDEFKSDRRKAAICWSISFAQFGNKLKPKWQRVLRELADDTELPAQVPGR